MPVVNRIAEFSSEVTAWRHDLHAHPELGYQEHRTAAKVAERLRAMGCDQVVTGIGRTGLVATISGRAPGPAIALRADMDALPIEEATGLAYRSTAPGIMHACGHDGHTAMLLGAALYLAETRRFAGTAVLVFQPAEEGGAGARAMIEDGLLERFAIEEVYGMHNYPGMDIGRFGLRAGPMMAAVDQLDIVLEGVGGHAARPHFCTDPILAGSAIVQALQSFVSRNVDPLDSAVVSITVFQAGSTDNVIPQAARLRGTVRTLKPETRDLAEARVRALVEHVAQAHGVKASLDYMREYPSVVNHAAETAFAASVAAEIAGADAVDANIAPVMGGEDFAFMLEKRPGAFIFAGNGMSAGLHNPAYDFADGLIPYGASYWARLVEARLPAA